MLAKVTHDVVQARIRTNLPERYKHYYILETHTHTTRGESITNNNYKKEQTFKVLLLFHVCVSIFAFVSFSSPPSSLRCLSLLFSPMRWAWSFEIELFKSTSPTCSYYSSSLYYKLFFRKILWCFLFLVTSLLCL